MVIIPYKGIYVAPFKDSRISQSFSFRDADNAGNLLLQTPFREAIKAGNSPLGTCISRETLF